jgi:hypothetical protein
MMMMRTALVRTLRKRFKCLQDGKGRKDIMEVLICTKAEKKVSIQQERNDLLESNNNDGRRLLIWPGIPDHDQLAIIDCHFYSA